MTVVAVVVEKQGTFGCALFVIREVRGIFSPERDYMRRDMTKPTK